MQKIFFIIICLFTLFRSPEPAKAEFVAAWIAAGVVIGIVVEKVSHSNEESEKTESCDN